MNTAYTREQIIENDAGWIFYDAAFKCWKAIYSNLSGYQILDIGCASGTMMALHKLFDPNLLVVGFEGSTAASEAWKERGLTVKAGDCYDIYSIPFASKSFTTAYSSHVLEHCLNPEIIVKESVRLAKQRIIHVVPDGDVGDKNFGSPHQHIFNRKNFAGLFPYGTKISSIQDTHMNSLMAVYNVQ